MKTFTDACVQIADNIKQIEAKIKTLEATLQLYEENAVRWPVDQILSRLLALAEAIVKETSQLQAEYSNKGCVWISLGNTGIGIIKWEDNQELLADRESLKARGMTVLFPAEMLELINLLITELGKGNWVPAVTWLNNHWIYSDKSGRPL